MTTSPDMGHECFAEERRQAADARQGRADRGATADDVAWRRGRSRGGAADEAIELCQVATHNLKKIDVRFPLGKITVVTGVSGSGKSSLVFDTLYGESYRRYVESLSSFARQYLKALPKPDVATVRNLPAAIAVRQARGSGGNRSTVGTATEMLDLLRVLYVYKAKLVCPGCGEHVARETPESTAAKTQLAFASERVLITAPLSAYGKISAKDLKDQLAAQGFSRVLLAQAPGAEGGWSERLRELGEVKAAELKAADVVIDRIRLGDGEVPVRLVEAMQLAMRAGRGIVHVHGEHGGVKSFSRELECLTCRKSFLEASLSLFSYNHPLGACSACQGFGYAAEIDWNKVLPDPSKSLVDEGVACWNFGQFAEYYTWAKSSARRLKFDPEKPFGSYTARERAWLEEGDGAGAQFDGVRGFFRYLESKKYKAHYRIHAARFRKYVLCPSCHGARLNEQALAYRLRGLSLAELCAMPLVELDAWVGALIATLTKGPTAGAAQEAEAVRAGMLGVEEAFEELQARLRYLRKVGVMYLTLDRSTRTLSGGETQRINMARCLGSALTETLYCLDEPSSGLHARDTRNLLEVVRELRDQGNTVVLVEHERAMIGGADHLIEIGPGAGHEGGHVTYSGPVSGQQKSDASLGADFAKAASSRRALSDFLELKAARTHNLKGIDVRFPVGAVSAVCGVSGSGKTSLIQHTFYPMVAKALGSAVANQYASEPAARSLGPAKLLARHAEVLLMSQAALGRSSRSNIATYLGLMDDLCRLFAAEPEAVKLGLTPGQFRFNTPGGRCETCRGLGRVVEDLSFLGEMEIVCPACEGRRFGEAVLSVRCRGHDLNEVLQMTVAEARSFLFDRPASVRALDDAMAMGLGYLTLGQNTASFSGGEAQRLKLAAMARDVKTAKPSILIFDEPTTGLSDRDVAKLIGQLQAMADRGHTVIVVEHHLDVLRQADWLVEIGPEAGARGGEVVYQGPPVGLAEVARSLTAPFLWSKS